MSITLGTTRKGQYAIMRTEHSFVMQAGFDRRAYYLYSLVEVHSATREGKVKTYRDYGATGAALSVDRMPHAVFMALPAGRPFNATESYASLSEIMDALHIPAPSPRRDVLRAQDASVA